jgi:hypothetical protein
MNCHEAIERILEADPAELAGDVPSPLGEHLQACSRCQVMAWQVLSRQGALAKEMARLRPRVPAEELLAHLSLDRPRETENQAEGGAPAGEMGRRRPRRVWGRWVAGAVPVAAAAALAVLLLGDGSRQPLSVREFTPSVLPPSTAPEVEPGTSRDFAVLETRNPNISVVWFF